MAIDINLNIYTPENNHIARVYLYFGPKLIGLGDEFQWVESIGMTVDGPWAFDKDAVRHDCNVAKELLKSWIDNGYLGRYSGKQDCSTFLDNFPSLAIFNLWFVDWS